MASEPSNVMAQMLPMVAVLSGIDLLRMGLPVVGPRGAEIA